MDPETTAIVCQVVNTAQKSITLGARQAVAVITPAQLLSRGHPQQNTLTHDVYTLNNVEQNISHAEKLQSLREKGFNTTNTDITQEEFEQLVDLLYQYKDCFATEVTDLCGVKDIEYKIRLKENAQPKRPGQYKGVAAVQYCPVLPDAIDSLVHTDAPPS